MAQKLARNLIPVYFAFSFQSSEAGITSINKQFSSMINETYNDDRSVSFMLGAQLQNLDHSGCYCYFDANYHLGKSQPVSKVDSWCKMLHEGYTCAILDSEIEGYECVPWEVDYTPGWHVGDDKPALRDYCEGMNYGDPCAIDACIVESYFLILAFQDFVALNSHDTDLLHSNGFDPSERCPINSGRQSEYECCGEYPDRKAFKTHGGEKDCCQNNEVFNVVTQSCCIDGTVQDSCHHI